MKKGSKDNMTKLELIEEKIKDYERYIADREKHYIPYLKKRNLYEAVVRAQEQIKIFREKVELLHQIKAILEAWEFTKEELNLRVIERNCGIFGSRYALRCDCEDDIPLLDKEVESFKKALEVSNESNK